MKKTLIALAVLATSGASMAQVTVGGALGFSYQKDRTTPTAVHGMQMTDGHVNFTAKEDLGGGFVVTAKSEFLLRGRDTAIAGRDATLSLMTPVGLITLGAVEAGNGIIDRGWAGAPVSLPTGFDGGIIGGSNNVDVAAFNTKIAGVVVGLSYAETGTQDISDLADKFGNLEVAPGVFLNKLTGGAAGNKAPGGPGTGAGPLQNVGINASYDNGPLSIGFSFSQNSTSVNGLADVTAQGLIKSAYEGRQSTSISASYNLGVATVGAGFNTKNKGWARETVFGVSVPMGAATLGLIYAAKTDDSVTLGDGVTAASVPGGTLATFPTAGLIAADLKGSAAKTGVALGVDYALSKMTTVNVSYGIYDIKAADRGAAKLGGADASGVTNEYRIRLLKTF